MSAPLESRRPVQVALLGSRGIPARYGGFETLIETLALNLPKDRFRITVFCESSSRRIPTRIAGVSFVYFPVLERLRLVSEVFYDVVSLAWSALAPVEVVILFGYTASLFCFLPRLFGKPVHVNVDGFEWKRSKFPVLVRFLLRLAELMVTKTATSIICDSRAVRKYFWRQYRAPSHYIPNPALASDAASLDLVQSLALGIGSYYLVVARLEPENHVDMIIEGFLESRVDRKLVIVGPLVNTRYVRRLTSMQGRHVIFVGGVYDRTLLNGLRAGSFAYIHGHEVGGTNPSLLESMACGNSVIALDVPFNREVARDAALYFKSSSELAQRIATLEKDQKRASRMRERAKTIAKDEYSTASVVAGYAELLSSVSKIGR